MFMFLWYSLFYLLDQLWKFIEKYFLFFFVDIYFILKIFYMFFVIEWQTTAYGSENITGWHLRHQNFDNQIHFNTRHRSPKKTQCCFYMLISFIEGTVMSSSPCPMRKSNCPPSFENWGQFYQPHSHMITARFVESAHHFNRTCPLWLR